MNIPQPIFDSLPYLLCGLVGFYFGYRMALQKKKKIGINPSEDLVRWKKPEEGI
jgi:hypothetical protein